MSETAVCQWLADDSVSELIKALTYLIVTLALLVFAKAVRVLFH